MLLQDKNGNSVEIDGLDIQTDSTEFELDDDLILVINQLSLELNIKAYKIKTAIQKKVDDNKAAIRKQQIANSANLKSLVESDNFKYEMSEVEFKNYPEPLTGCYYEWVADKSQEILELFPENSYPVLATAPDAKVASARLANLLELHCDCSSVATDIRKAVESKIGYELPKPQEAISSYYSDLNVEIRRGF